MKAKLGKGVDLDVQTLVESRLLIQANSGGGKSWTVRRFVEQLYGKVQVIVVDPDGEYHTLREKFDFILAGKDGDCPADIRSAALLAKKLLELEVSAIVDIYELGQQRAMFVQRFMTALVNAPRSLWHPVIVVVDEAHKFCLDDETEILTNEGWRRHHEIDAGAVVVAFDKANGEYRYQEISDVIRKWHDGKMVVFKSDGIDCHVTAEHRVVLRRMQRASGRVKLYDWTFCQADSVPHHIYVPLGGAPVGDGLEISEDMLRLIGWVATDGCFTGGSSKRYLSISQAYATNKRGRSMLDELSSLLARLGGKSRYERPIRKTKGSKHGGPSVDFYLGRKLSAEVLSWIGESIHRIPRHLINNCSRAQLEFLMQGLLEGDGTSNKNGWCTFYPGHNEGLADDFQEVALRLGMSTSKKLVPQTGQWVVYISKRQHHYIRKPSESTYRGVVWCVTLPAGAFVARRRGKVFVTGNCPEKEKCISTSAVVDLMTLGRKRGFCGVLATQRIAKLNKDAAAECNNKLIGRTSLDIDMKRAADELGFTSKEDRLTLRTLEAGQFYAYGPALSSDGVKLFKVGEVETTHLRAGQRAQKPPPPPAKVKKLLGQLADLPHEAEVEARSMEELQTKYRQLEAELRAAKKVVPKVEPAKIETKIVEKQVIKAGDLKRLEALVKKLDGRSQDLALDASRIDVTVTTIKEIASRVAKIHRPQQTIAGQSTGPSVSRRATAAEADHAAGNGTRSNGVARSPLPNAAPGVRSRNTPVSQMSDSEALPKGEIKVLSALIQFPDGLTGNQMSVLTGYTQPTRDAYITRLTGRGLVQRDRPGHAIAIQPAASQALPTIQPLPTGEALQEYWLNDLPVGEAKVLRVVLDAYPSTIHVGAISEATGYTQPTRDAYITRMVGKQILKRESPGYIKASETLFD